jgi:hypothetical protein
MMWFAPVPETVWIEAMFWLSVELSFVPKVSDRAKLRNAGEPAMSRYS